MTIAFFDEDEFDPTEIEAEMSAEVDEWIEKMLS